MNSVTYQVPMVKAIRNFFAQANFDEVLVPPMVENPGMETHIHPFQIQSKLEGKALNLYLQSSPEFALKRILAQTSLERIYTLNYAFRDEPQSPIHRPQFLMLEWYRTGVSYEQIMQDCQSLLDFCLQELAKTKLSMAKTQLTIQRRSVQEIFQEFLNIDILDYLDPEALRAKIRKDFKQVPLPDSKLAWEDYFFLLFLNEVEPHLSKYEALIIYEYPHHLSALANIKQEDPRVCKRFELYLHGVEIANCYDELVDAKEQRERFDLAAKNKLDLYGYELPSPTQFYQALEKGIPPCSGIALGVERLFMSLTGQNKIFLS